MVALLVGISIMAVALSVALPTWRTMAQREREAELVFRGEQYARAIALYQRKYANAFPANVDLLVDQKFLRRKYLDPMTNGEFQVLLVGQATPGQGGAGAGAQGGGAGQPGQLGRAGGNPQPAGLAAQPLGGAAGIMGVSSKSDATSLREYKGRTRYNEWVFVAVQASTRAGGPGGTQTPGQERGLGPGAGGGATPTGRGGQGLQGPGGGRGTQPGGPRGASPFGGPAQPFGTPNRGGRF